MPANYLSAFNVKPIDSAPLNRAIGNIPNQMRANQNLLMQQEQQAFAQQQAGQRMNLLQRQDARAEKQQAFNFEQADKATQTKIMDGFLKSWAAVGDNPEHRSALLGYMNEKIPGFGGEEDIPEFDARSAQYRGKPELKNYYGPAGKQHTGVWDGSKMTPLDLPGGAGGPERIAQPSPGYKDLKSQATVEKGIRGGYTGITAPFRKVRDSWARVQASSKNPTPAGDLSMIFNYMKMLDPGSVVRESEFQTAAESGSYGERIRAAVGRIRTGKRLTKAMRDDFRTKAESLYARQDSQYQSTLKTYRGIAKGLGVDPSRSAPDFTPPEFKGGKERVFSGPPSSIPHLKERLIGDIWNMPDGRTMTWTGEETKWEEVR